MHDNDKVNALLEEGEVIRWSGVAQPYSIFDETHKKSTIRLLYWVFASIVILAGGYYTICVLQDREIMMGVMIFFLVFPLLFAWWPVTDKNKVKKLVYAVTNKKAFTVSQENDKARVMHIADIDGIRVEETKNGNCHIRIGSPAFKAPERNLPLLSSHGVSASQDENDNKCKGLVFYNVSAEDGKTISGLLKPAVAPGI